MHDTFYNTATLDLWVTVEAWKVRFSSDLSLLVHRTKEEHHHFIYTFAATL
jgi:hypothetical protein